MGWTIRTVGEYKLQPKNGRMSFYGKAKVLKQEKLDGSECKTLLSYDTEIMRIYPDGSAHVLLDPDDSLFSITTSSHVKSFCGLTKNDCRKIYNQTYSKAYEEYFERTIRMFYTNEY